jgi:DNA (cytosine-5)-methyltransferase 1
MSARAYYNEIDPYCCAWLSNLMDAGQVMPGFIDDRSIEDVQPSDLVGYARHHFFAGLGGWDYALTLAGWPTDQPVWTGSCPCQPFSAAGQGGGFDDERHLWPAFHWLIEQCGPGHVFGEQVASPAGRDWLDLVCTDMEAGGYACGAALLSSSGRGAPHIRNRLYWLAERMGYPGHAGLSHPQPQDLRAAGRDDEGRTATKPSSALDPWRELEWIACRDGRARPTGPGIHPLAARFPGHVGQLRAIGNAITPQVAESFIRSYLDAATFREARREFA